MDAIALLKKDHREVKAMFEEAAQLGERAAAARRKLFEKIDEALKTHTHIEEAVFYPAFKARAKREKAEEERDEILEAYEEHHVVDRLMEVMEETDAKDESYKAKLQVLCELVDHHVKEEEHTLFKMAKRLFSKEELEQLGAQMEAEKEELEAGA